MQKGSGSREKASILGSRECKMLLCSASQERHTSAMQAKRGRLGAGQRHTSAVQAQREGGGQRQPRAPGHTVPPSLSSSPLAPPSCTLFRLASSPYKGSTLLRGFLVQCLLRERTLETYCIYIICSAPSH